MKNIFVAAAEILVNTGCVILLYACATMSIFLFLKNVFTLLNSDYT
jgi:hypothetical protein